MIQQFPVSSCLGVRSLVQNSSVRCQALCPGPRKAANEPSHLEPLWWTSWCMEGSMQKGWCKGKGLGNFSFAASAGSRWRFWFSGLRIGWMQDCNWKIKILLKTSWDSLKKNPNMSNYSLGSCEFSSHSLLPIQSPVQQA